MTIQSINSKAVSMMKTGWPEFCFIVTISAGVVAFSAAVIITIGQLTGAHTSMRHVPVFSDCPPEFLLFSALYLAIVYFAYIPLYYGIRWFYFQAASGTIMPLASLFSCYSSRAVISRCIRMKLSNDLAGLLRVLPGAAVIAASVYGAGKHCNFDFARLSPYIIFALTVVIIVVLLVSFLLSVDLIYSAYIFTMDINKKPREVLAASKKMAKLGKGILPRLCFSALPVLVLIPIVFPMMFYLPYFNYTISVSLRCVMDDKGLNDITVFSGDTRE